MKKKKDDYDQMTLDDLVAGDVDFNEKKDGLSIYDTANPEYGKSNVLIGAKYKASLLENKLMAISLSRIQAWDFIDEGENGGLVCELKASELRDLLDANAGSFYQQLEPVARAMTSRSIGITNPEKNSFEYMAVITNAKYENGTLTIRYNYSLKKYIRNLNSNFTLLSLPTMLSFKGNYSFRLYELLRSRAYYPKGVMRTEDAFKIDFGLAELKLEMGVVNAELDSVRRILNGNESPDFEKAVEKSPEQTFRTWYELRRRVLLPAVEEINEKTELTCSFEPKKGGRGNKVYGVTFYVQYKKERKAEEVIIEEKKELTEDEKIEFYISVREIVPIRLSIKDVRAISEAAEFQLSKIQKACDALEMTREKVDNVTGWLITAIKKGYEAKSKSSDAKKEKVEKTGFSNYDERQYDMDALEKLLVE
ncbi:MAG: RepB family plasmid replication initiator protein [Dorea sp.]|nr:RepB family plasmid replication initiator protein [Dorea sp.]